LKNAKENNIEKNDIIVCMHYPPISKNYQDNEFEKKLLYILKEYDVKKCLYGHLHGTSHLNAVNGNIDGIEFRLVSADYLNFKLLMV